MSLADLLPAIRALPRAEKAELLHLLVDDVTAVNDGLTDEMRMLLPPPGSVVDTAWPIFTDVRGMEMIERMRADGVSARV